MARLLRFVLVCGAVAACALDPHASDDPEPGSGSGAGSGSTGSGSGSAPSPSSLPDIRCAGTPQAGPAEAWRHLRSEWVAEHGAPHHRGIDLIATDDQATQTLAGKITYGPTDKDLEDEDIDLFACAQGAWQRIGRARTDGDGRFALALAGADRLSVGVRDLYLSVAGDRSGAAFVALIAPPTTRIVVSDVDGTLTSHENAYPESLALGGDVAAHPDAAAALGAAAATGHAIVYITARGDRFTQDTRDWFAAQGFPRGPVRMPTSIVTQPGEDTIEFKSAALASLAAFDLSAGIGNRASDIAAYTSAGLPPARIFIKLPEYEDEVQSQLAAGNATGFTAYATLAL